MRSTDLSINLLTYLLTSATAAAASSSSSLECTGHGKNFSLKTEEDVEELMQTLVAQIHAKLKSDLNLREIHIPNGKAEARCSIFASHNYAACPKLCVFMQPGEGLVVVVGVVFVGRGAGA